MQDREPQVGREGRVRIIQDDGTVIEGVLEMADNATIQGTPYNKATQLSDSVAQALKLTPLEEATVNDALGLLPGVISDLNNVQLSMLTMETGTYTEGGGSSASDPIEIELSFVPTLFFYRVIASPSTTFSFDFGCFIQIDGTLQPGLQLVNGNVTMQASARVIAATMNGNTLSMYSSGRSGYGAFSGDFVWVAIGQKFDNTVTVSCKNSSGQLQDGCVVTLGENDPVVSNSTEPLVFKTVSSAPVLTVVSPIDYGGKVQTQTLDLSNTQNLSVDVTVDTSTHVTSGTITSSIVGAFSSLAATVNLLCVGGGGNGMMCPQIAWNTAPFASGGSGGGGARKNNYATAGKRFSMTPGGRASTSTIYADDQIICQATGGKNGVGNNIRDFPNDDPSTPAISYSSVPEPGTGIVGDVLMTGAKPAQIMVSGQNTGMSLIYNTSAQQPTAGNVTNLAGTQIAGAGATRSDYGYYDGYYFYPSNGTSTNPTQGGGAIASNATLAGAGGGAAPNGQSAGLGMAGIIEWEVVS